MTRFIFTLLLIANAMVVQAQSRKYISNFSLFQQYYNPALTGYEGSMLKTFYRNQWTGFEGAPKTMFFSGELDLRDLSSWKKDNTLKTNREDHFNRETGVSHAFGLSVLQDQFGPFVESQVMINYGTRVRLTEKTSLRMGAAIYHGLQRLDGSRLILDQDFDQQYQDLLGRNNRVGRVDINLGLMLTAEKFYFGYAMQDVTQGEMLSSGDSFMKGAYPLRHIIQSGYRMAVSDQVGLIVNGIFQSDNWLGQTVEGQVKAMYQNMFWLGGGYRHNLAYTFSGGLRLNQIKIGYAFEVPTADAKSIRQNTNEIMLTYNFINVKYPKLGRQVTMW